MSDFKEFQGKTLDEAIESACEHYDLQRNKLEIDIISGGSSGIFGLVGAKKAVVKARPRGAVDTDDILNGKDEKKGKAPKKEAKKSERPKQERKRPEKKPSEPKAEKPRQEEKETKVAPEVAMGEIPSGPVAKPKSQPRPRREELPEEEERSAPQAASEPKPVVDEFADMDKGELEAVVREVTCKLLEPIIGEEPSLEVSFDPDRIKVFIDDEENSGLIIGREGQTLSSLQYLVNRLVSRRMEASIRIQIDTGEYRERQDEKLRQIAQHLADKAKRIGRTQSTKPLSSYHRRVVHLALQENETVFTRSKGDGPMKRVLIVPKRKNNNRRQRQ